MESISFTGWARFGNYRKISFTALISNGRLTYFALKTGIDEIIISTWVKPLPKKTKRHLDVSIINLPGLRKNILLA
jgi:hypothetical protein